MKPKERMRHVYGPNWQTSSGWDRHTEIWGRGGLAGHLVGKSPETTMEETTEEEQEQLDVDDGNST